MREFDQIWSSNGTTGGQTAVEVHGDVLQSKWYFTASTGVATATIVVQSGPTSTGPWFDEAGSTAVSSGARVLFSVAGPFGFVRPYLGSTGITVRAVGVS